jgi:hypothetical protein
LAPLCSPGGAIFFIMTTNNSSVSQATSLNEKPLSSLWDGLSSHLIATFYEVAKTGEDSWGRIEGKTDPIAVKAPLTEAKMEMVLNWQGPFEQAGPESKAPALMAMLQSGALQPVVDAVMGGSDAAQEKSNGFLKQFEGRTGITKLNSTQVFNGMPPVKITVTALFRAWSDSLGEVEAPVNKLMDWALPIELSRDGSLLANAIEYMKGGKAFIEALMPSKAPTRIAMKYKGRTYAPLVIELIELPLDSPVDSTGRFVQLVVPMTLCTLTAIDRQDWSNTMTSAM